MSSTILLVEDDPDAREIARIILELHSYEVLTAVNGIEAISKANIEPIDLIILDISIPPKNGVHIMARMRENPKLNNIPIVAFTALSSIDEQEMLKREGFDGVIPKPCRPEEIVETVEKFLKE
ncbi:MAG: response regulator [Candidatus Eremiobacteraeota bacterium]|nr:response regulator [Candidatus Eremiobacteraeota bacterium]